jgi:ATP-dependent helicase HepA
MEHRYINENQTRVAPEIIKEVINTKSDVIKMLLGKSRDLTEKEVPELKQQAVVRSNDILQTEVDRLVHMREVNPNVRLEEIYFFKNQLKIACDLIESATTRLDALRVIITI